VKDAELVEMESELVDVESVTPLGGYNVRLVFSDGAERTLDLDPYLQGPIFESIRDQEYFRRVRVDPETGTIAWPNGADIDPIVLRYGLVPAWMEEGSEAQIETPAAIERFRTGKEIRPFGGRRISYVLVILIAGAVGPVLVAGLLSESPPLTVLVALMAVLLTELLSFFLLSYLELRLQRQSQDAALKLATIMDVAFIAVGSDGEIQVVASAKAGRRTRASTASSTKARRGSTAREREAQ
jgi:hypothetical protein